MKRSGGFAGLTKQWRAEPAQADAPAWIELITRCPWDAPTEAEAEAADGVGGDGGPDSVDGAAGAPVRLASAGPGADRFVWWIQARCGEDEQREAELPDDELIGAWRELVDAVRDWSRAAG
ncbi:hypothetical protein OB08_08915 [Microbacterium sp. HJ5]